MKRSGALLLACLAFAACSDDAEWSGTMSDSAGVVIVQNPAAAEWTLVEQPTIAEELDIGEVDGAPEYQFGMVAAIDVAEDGRIFVLDQQAAHVRMFDAQGTYLGTVGKPGSGPGELSEASVALLVGAGDTVYVADMMQQRIVRFAPDGTEAGSVPVPMSEGIPVAWAVSPQHSFVTQVRPMAMPGMASADSAAAARNRDWILARNTRGEVVDTLLDVESGATFRFSSEGMSMRLFESEPLWTLLSDGRVAHGRNDSYRIEILRDDRTVERIISKPFERAPVTESDRNAFLALLRESMQEQVPPQIIDQFLAQVKFADHYPAFARMLGGPDNTLWVQHVRTARDAEVIGGTFDAQDVGAPQWDVYDAEGRLLGVLEMPPRFQPMRVIGSHIYGVQRDDLDVQHVIRLRIGDGPANGTADR
jgi:hypothetical protein